MAAPGGATMGGMRVERVSGAETVGLRRRVLRPHQQLDEVVFPGDGDPDTAHVAMLGDDDEILAVGTVLRQGSPHAGTGERAPGAPASEWRIRGMATAEGQRRRGMGRAVLDALLAHVADHGGGMVWCNARVPAVEFYRRAGFATRGEVWEEPDIGPHIVMETRVGAARLTPGDGFDPGEGLTPGDGFDPGDGFTPGGRGGS